MNRPDYIHILQGELKDTWMDYYDFVKEQAKLKKLVLSDDKMAEVATTMFIQHSIIVDHQGLWSAKEYPSSFQNASDIKKELPTTPTHSSAPAQAPASSGPTKQEDTGIFGTDAKGKTWPTTLVCMGKNPDGTLCHGKAEVKKSQKGNIYAICPTCDYFLKYDGTRGFKVQHEEDERR